MLRMLADDHTRAIAVVLHDLDHAAAIADRIVVIARGVVLADGSPTEVLTSELLFDAFGVRADVVVDAHTGTPRCVFRLPTREESTCPVVP
jgi:iron complex transport system ATP-binding protein